GVPGGHRRERPPARAARDRGPDGGRGRGDPRPARAGRLLRTPRAGGCERARARDRAPLSRARVVAGAAALPTLAALPGARLLDVRGEDAFARGHVEGAGRLSLDEFTSRRAELPPREAAVVVADDVPQRARAAAEALVALGYERVAWLE